MLPALIGQLVVVLKDTALGTSSSTPSCSPAAKTLGSAYANTVPAYLVAALLFIVINYTLTKVAGYVERRMKRRRRSGPYRACRAPRLARAPCRPRVGGHSGSTRRSPVPASRVDRPDRTRPTRRRPGPPAACVRPRRRPGRGSRPLAHGGEEVLEHQGVEVDAARAASRRPPARSSNTSSRSAKASRGRCHARPRP